MCMYFKDNLHEEILIFKFHRTLECIELKGNFRDHLIQSFCIKQGQPQPDQVAQTLIKPDLECVQGWDLHDLPW